MARFNGFSGLVVRMDWAEMRVLLVEGRRYVEAVGEKVKQLAVLDGDVTYLCEVAIASADDTNWIDTVKPTAKEYVGPRYTLDGRLNIASDPGTATTDPDYYDTRASVIATGGVWVDLSSHTFIGEEEVYMQSVYLQVYGHEYGDTVKIAFRSDGTQPGTFGPLGTEIKNFGTMNVPLKTAANGWSDRIEEPGVKIGTAKQTYAGLKISLLYTAVTIAERKLAIDVIMQE